MNNDEKIMKTCASCGNDSGLIVKHRLSFFTRKGAGNDNTPATLTLCDDCGILNFYSTEVLERK